MPIRDLHKEPFDEGTITKLEIFEAYTSEWLPVFIHYSKFDRINICDFFAGSGQDVSKTPGSPLRIISCVQDYKAQILKTKRKVNLIFNDADKKKADSLKKIVTENVDSYLMDEGLLEIEYFAEDFKDLFLSKKDSTKNDANLFFLDQNGIKNITNEVFQYLEGFEATDFLFFISSSYFKRFGEEKCFKDYFPDLDITDLRSIDHVDGHRFILNYYKSKLPHNSKTRLYPFTIKKGPNVNGLIFGSKHPRGIDKFLRLAWKTNRLNGEANFDIDDDLAKKQPELFEQFKRKTKIEKFEEELTNLILSKMRLSNKEIYDFTLESGHISEHTNKVVKRLKAEGKIRYSGHTKINYDKCYKINDIIYFEVLNSEKNEN